MLILSFREKNIYYSFPFLKIGLLVHLVTEQISRHFYEWSKIYRWLNRYFWTEICRCWVVHLSCCDVTFCCVPRHSFLFCFLAYPQYFFHCNRLVSYCTNLTLENKRYYLRAAPLFLLKMCYAFYIHFIDLFGISNMLRLCVSSVTDSCSGTAVFALLYSLAAGKNHWRLPFQSK